MEMSRTGRESDVPKGDDDELRILRAILDIVRDDRDIAEVQGSIDLVHEVQRSGFVDVQREDERERAQSLEARSQNTSEETRYAAPVPSHHRTS